MKRYIFIFLSSILAISTNAKDNDVPDKSFRLSVDLGFCHWYADDLSTSVDLTHPTIGIGLRPGPEFLQLRLRYDMSRVEAPAGGPAESFSGDFIHFISGGLALCQKFSHNNQQLIAHAGLNAVVPVLGDAVSLGGSLGIGIEYMISVNPNSNHSFGIFMEARNQYYELNLPDGGKTDTQCDLVVDLGVIAILW